MDKKQQLIDIVKGVKFPAEVETMLLEDINKHEPLTDEYILEVSDLLDRLGAYFQASAEAQSAYLDRLEAEAGKVNDAMSVLNSIADQLEDNSAATPSQTPAPAAPMTDTTMATQTPVAEPAMETPSAMPADTQVQVPAYQEPAPVAGVPDLSTQMAPSAAPVDSFAPAAPQPMAETQAPAPVSTVTPPGTPAY